MLYNAFLQIVGQPPLDFEFLPYIFTCIILYMVCRFLIEFVCNIYNLIISFFK